MSLAAGGRIPMFGKVSLPLSQKRPDTDPQKNAIEIVRCKWTFGRTLEKIVLSFISVIPFGTV